MDLPKFIFQAKFITKCNFKAFGQMELMLFDNIYYENDLLHDQLGNSRKIFWKKERKNGKLTHIFKIDVWNAEHSKYVFIIKSKSFTWFCMNLTILMRGFTQIYIPREIHH